MAAKTPAQSQDENHAPGPERDLGHDEVKDLFSEYYDGALPPGEHRALAAHLADCDDCRAEYDEFGRALRALSGLHKMNAPQSFERDIEDTLRRRSAGRFFGRKAFGDRVPFEALAIAFVILGVVIAFLLWSSDTGSLRYQPEQPVEPEIDPQVKEVVPQPAPLPK